MPRGRPLKPLDLSVGAHDELESRSRSRSLPAGLVRRAKIVLMCADGWDNRTLWKKGNQSFVVRDDSKLVREDSDAEAVYEFYDLEGDPWEEKNQVDEPRFAQDVAALRRELDAWHEEQDGRANRIL